MEPPNLAPRRFHHLLHPRPLLEKVDCDLEVLDIDVIHAVDAVVDHLEFPVAADY